MHIDCSIVLLVPHIVSGHLELNQLPLGVRGAPSKAIHCSCYAHMILYEYQIGRPDRRARSSGLLLRPLLVRVEGGEQQEEKEDREERKAGGIRRERREAKGEEERRREEETEERRKYADGQRQ